MKFNKRYANLVVATGGRGAKKPSPNANAGIKDKKWLNFNKYQKF